MNAQLVGFSSRHVLSPLHHLTLYPTAPVTELPMDDWTYFRGFELLCRQCWARGPSSFWKRMPVRTLLLLSLLCRPSSCRNTELQGAAKPVYSWYQCIQRCYLEQNECEFTSDWKVTSCHFRNVCVDTETKKIAFFRDPENTHASIHTDEFYSQPAGFPKPLVYLAGGNTSPEEDDIAMLTEAEIFTTPMPDKHVKLKGPVVYMEPFVPDNFGHCLADNAFPAFRLLKRFGLAQSPATILFKHYDASDDCSTGACKNIRNIFNPALTQAPFYSLGRGSLQTNETKYACAEDLVMGFGKLGMYSDSEVWDQFNSRLLKAVGISPDAAPSKHKIVVFLKKGRRSTTNVYEMARHLQESFEVQVQVADIAKMSYAAQAKLVSSATVVISPCGGLSFSTVFLPKNAAAVYVCTWDPNVRLQLQIERFWYDRQTRFQAVYYPVDESEITINTTYAVKGAGDDHELNEGNLYRNFADVTVSLPKMDKVVYSALHMVDLGMGWDPTYQRPAHLEAM